MLLSPASCLLGLLLATKTPQISERDLQQAIEEGAEYIKSATVEKDFVIVKSTASYREARRAAEDAARRLSVRVDLRDLSPHSGGGLTFSRKECEDGAFDYPCYVARGRGDDGFYVSVEYSTAYAGFRPGLYVVIVASDAKGGQIAADAVRAARKVFKDAYVRRTGVYMGCIH
jgi:hypothetical protein